MTKFHDEFFNKGSPRHDRLVIQTVENIKEIYNQTIHKEVISDLGIKLIMREVGWTYFRADYNIFICNCKNQCVWCNDKVAWKSEPKCKREGNYCNHLVDKNKILNSPEYKEASKWCEPSNFSSICYEKVKAEESFKDSKWSYISSETEKLCKSGGFIIGYEDVSFNFTEEMVFDALISKDWIWKDFEKISIPITIVTECKPDLESWGGPLRQLKTYIDLERQKGGTRCEDKKLIYGLFTTYSQVSVEVRSLLRKEGIFVFTFDEGKDNKQSLLFRRVLS